MNVKEVAKYLGVSSGMVYQLAAPHGPIPCYRIGKRISFDLSDIETFKQASRVVAAPKLRVRPPSRKITITDGKSELLKTFAKLGIKPRLS